MQKTKWFGKIPLVRGSLAQLVERLPYKQVAIGSSPITSTIIFCGNGSVVERHLAMVDVASSNLVSRSKAKEQTGASVFFMNNYYQKIKTLLKIKISYVIMQTKK